jgi:hypothetical protein
MSLKSLKNQTLRNKSTINSVNLTGGASTGPAITSIIVTDSSYNNLDDTALLPAGGYAKLIGSGFASGCSAYFNGSSVTTTFVSATEVRVVIPATSAGTYNVMLFNTSTNGAIYLNLGISAAPTFTTTAGSLGTSYETTAFSTSIAATGDVPITYALYSGSLPTGFTLASNGTLSGTSPVEASSTTYSFVVQATDAELQDTTRSFSLTISSDIVTWSTPTADYVHTALTKDSVMANVSLSAASAAGYNITYAANTLPTGVSLSGNTVFGTPTTGQTVYTALTATAATSGRSATRYVSWVVAAFIDLYDTATFNGLVTSLKNNLNSLKNEGMYEYTLDDANQINLSDGGGQDMYDGGNNTHLFLAGTRVVSDINYGGTGNTVNNGIYNVKYAPLGYARPLSVIAATQKNVDTRYGFGRTGNFGADGTGSQDGTYLYSNATISSWTALNDIHSISSGFTVNAWMKRVYGATDPSICEIYVTIGHPKFGAHSFYSTDEARFTGDGGASFGPASTDNGFSLYETTSRNSLVYTSLLSKPNGSAVQTGEAQQVILNLLTIIKTHFSL